MIIYKPNISNRVKAANSRNGGRIGLMKKDLLAPYKEKRDFSMSPEPTGDLTQENAARAFVVQKHDARSTHYDLRLELDGVLKSWAVPKGPSGEPGQKRLAVHVEDHPVEYLDFEGTIPPRQYGAGDMIIWDRGTWEPIGDPRGSIQTGHLKFYLHGQKLQGKWALVQMQRKNDDNKNWLLIKERDADVQPGSVKDQMFKLQENAPNELFLTMPAGARPGPFPERLLPQLSALVDDLPVGDDWAYEIKFDGYRILTRIDQDSITLYTRNGHDWTAKLSSMVPALKELNITSGWLDGEIVILGENGAPDFGALQSAFETGRSGEIIYYVFDLLYYAGYDLREVTLTSRRILLNQILKGTTSTRLRFSENFAGNGLEIFHSACNLGLEGIMGKRKDSVYVPGRSLTWIKLKCTKRQEFIIVGYTPPSRPAQHFKSLLLGVYDEAGQLHYAGKVGTGFNQNSTAMIKDKLDHLLTDHTLLHEIPAGVKAIWVKPELIAEVTFTEWTRDGKVRHGAFKGLRADTDPARIKRERPVDMDDNVFQRSRSSKDNKGGESPQQAISNPERVVDPSTALRKLDLANYYHEASRWILPYLYNRPAALVRAPEGLQGELFFQKHGDKLKIPGLKKADDRVTPGHPSLILINSLEALIGAVQMNVIEFHTGNAAVDNMEKPDRMVFDLDPGEGTTWAMMIEAAQLVRTMLEELDLLSFLKTSGGKGLHVVVPLKPCDDWETVKAFAKGVAGHLARVIPDYFTDVSGPRNRIGKIYVDYNRNGSSATTAEAFSVRARPGLGVSMPCSWEELTLLTSGAHWTVATAGPRLEREDHPWKDYNHSKQLLKAAAKKIMLTP